MSEPTGVYRRESVAGRQYAFVDFGKLAFEISRRMYEMQNFVPAFDDLPLKDEVFQATPAQYIPNSTRNSGITASRF